MAHNGFADLLKSRGFRAFLWTQFLGAFNDQVYQSIVFLHALTVHGGVYVPLVPAIFNLPFLLFSGYSGHLSDRVSKRSVLIGVKIFEIFVMGLGLATFLSGRFEGMLLVVFLMGLHSTVFSPAKYGIVPEMLGNEDLSRGNALLEMSTFVAIVLGIVTGTFLYIAWAGAAWRMGLATLGIAVAGLLVSRGIPRVRSAGATERFRFNPFAEIGKSTKHLLADRPLWLAVMGVSFFWCVGVLLRTGLEYFGDEALHAGKNGIGILWACLAIGIGCGNMLAGRWSGNKVELGLVPLGSALMGVFGIALWASRGSLALSAVSVALLALASGLFVVPLYAFIQQRSGSKEKGRVVATNNFYQTVGMLFASLAITLLHNRLHVSAATILLGLGILTLLLTQYIVTLVPEFFVRFLAWLATHTVFRIRIVGEENVPLHGPALLVANHMSQVDGFLIGATVQRFVRFMVWKPFYQAPGLNWFFRLAKAIPVDGTSRRDVIQSIHAARQELAEGHVVCIFAEGAVSRTGNMLPFKRGLEKIGKGLDAPIVPVHLDGMWGSIFSFERGRFFWKWPKRVPYPVTVSFGAPMPASSTAGQVRQAIQELGSDAWDGRKTPADLLDRRLIRNARRRWSRFAMADTTGRQLTWGRLLTAGVMVSNWLRGAGYRPGDYVGVLLPSSVAGAAVNVGITLAGRVPVNLNFTAGREAMASAAEQCRIETIVTAKAFLTKAKIAPMPGMVFVEDILGGAGAWARIRALLAARFAPAGLLSHGRRTPDSPAAVIFSSGSSGAPKGVVLSHYNVISNVEAISQLFWIGERDRMAGMLPFFHSFGFTVTIWFPLIAGCGVVYHPNPNEAQAVGELVEKYHATLLLGTPTFCAAYARKCSRRQFATLRYALVGAERLRGPVAAAFREKFGLELLEGYGCTEMSPVVAVNAPDFEWGPDTQTGNKPGTVGHPLPGVAAQIVDPVTLEPLAPNEEGLLLVKGPNRMLRYLGQPDLTAAVFHGGWYITGDIARIDDEGFIRITDRLSRFSKIGGEMAPHIRVEDAIAGILGECPCAVTAVEDERRGERLVALYACPSITPSELWQRLSATDLPRLWLPKQENLYPVESLPLLGAGKLDLRALKERARELVCELSEQRA
jgi:acyl-[acyl-carrier-protein]-phospholipid O-acyltransferase / long-chain-fatty-acid--[acyl-carrier-protein] ligase